jgi:aspartate-semialdehyde dehydrogenase
VVGAHTALGGLIRQALADRKVPGTRVDLYGAAAGEALLSEYDGEARLIQAPSREEVAGHEVIFLCDRGDAAARSIPEGGGSCVVIDLTGGDPNGDPGTRLVHLGINREALRGRPARVAVPHPLGIMLVEILEPLARAFGVRGAVALVLRPASDFGDEGVEELREQTVRLLSFSRVPKNVFGGQLAFNLIPQRLVRAAEPGLEATLAREVGELLGWSESRLTVRLVTAPVFYGHAVDLHVSLERPAGVEEVADVLGRGPALVAPSAAAAATPLEAIGRRRTNISELVGDGLGGFWIWAVAGEVATWAADHAVRLAEAMADL